MRLSELMSQFDLAIWPKMALVLFLTAFGAIIIRWMVIPGQQELDRAAAMPLDEEGEAP